MTCSAETSGGKGPGAEVQGAVAGQAAQAEGRRHVKTLLSGVKADEVIPQPFPHIVVREPLDPDVCARLLAEYPPLDLITRGRPFRSNQRFSYSAARVLQDARVSPLWKELVAVHVSTGFWEEFTELFGPSIRSLYPALGRDGGKLASLKVGVRGSPEGSDADVLLDAQICVNTPVTDRPSSVQPVHIDGDDELFAGLFYLRHPDDDSEGGDLELYRFKTPHRKFNGRTVDQACVERIKRIRYDTNVLVLFVNSLQSLHGVSPRSVTPKPRCFLNVLGDVRGPLFDVRPFQTAAALRREWLTRLRRGVSRLRRSLPIGHRSAPR
jgi:hypothetical protein